MSESGALSDLRAVETKAYDRPATRRRTAPALLGYAMPTVGAFADAWKYADPGRPTQIDQKPWSNPNALIVPEVVATIAPRRDGIGVRCRSVPSAPRLVAKVHGEQIDDGDRQQRAPEPIATCSAMAGEFCNAIVAQDIARRPARTHNPKRTGEEPRSSKIVCC